MGIIVITFEIDTPKKLFLKEETERVSLKSLVRILMYNRVEVISTAVLVLYIR